MDAQFKLEDPIILRALDRLEEAGADLGPVSKQIGEYLVFSTKRRFKTSTAPDGSPWQENSELAVNRFLAKTKGNFRKDGSRSKKGKQRAGNKKPLIGESGNLSNLINYNASKRTIEVGSPMIYARVHQFGAKQGAFGKNARNVPLPWGDIPARPYLGLSLADRQEIISIISDYYRKVVSG